MASRPGFNTKSPTIKRILQESKEMAQHPDPCLTAHPLETNLFEWHFTIAGPPSSPYEHGIYHGRIILPPTYPLRPPMFRFTTPSGRFETNREICLSISGHHEETWQPAWGVRTALCAIRAFMESSSAGQLGGLEVEEEARRRLARESRAWRCVVCGEGNEEILKGCRERWEEARREGRLKEGESEVPEELRLAYKEDLQGKKEGEGEGAQAEEMDGDSVKTQMGQASRSALEGASTGLAATSTPIIPGVPTQPVSSSSPAPQPSAPTRYAPAAPSSASPTPTRTVASTRIVSTDDGVPGWVDKAIFGVLLSLVIMILKRFLA